MLDPAALLWHIGSVWVGVTLTLLLLFWLGASRSDTVVAESCLVTILCGASGLIALACYVWASKI